MPFVRSLYLVWDMAKHFKELKFLYSDLKYKPLREPALPYEPGDYVEKITGDYHVRGFVIMSGKTSRGKTLYCVEHEAADGGSFCHLYSHFNLNCIKRKLK